MLKRICCKCNLDLGFKDDGRSEIQITHTYCPPCFEEEMETLNNLLPQKEREVANG